MRAIFTYSCILLGMFALSCSNDNNRSCVICNSPQTTNFEVCSDGDDNAVVNGESTGVSYDVYIADLEAAGATCGGG